MTLFMRSSVKMLPMVLLLCLRMEGHCDLEKERVALSVRNPPPQWVTSRKVLASLRNGHMFRHRRADNVEVIICALAVKGNQLFCPIIVKLKQSPNSWRLLFAAKGEIINANEEDNSLIRLDNCYVLTSDLVWGWMLDHVVEIPAVEILWDE